LAFNRPAQQLNVASLPIKGILANDAVGWNRHLLLRRATESVNPVLRIIAEIFSRLFPQDGDYLNFGF
jgi:hypothetical protein